MSNGVQRANFRQGAEFVLAQLRNMVGQIMDGIEWSNIACAHQGPTSFFTQSTNIAQAETKGELWAVVGEKQVPDWLSTKWTTSLARDDKTTLDRKSTRLTPVTIRSR